LRFDAPPDQQLILNLKNDPRRDECFQQGEIKWGNHLGVY
jgi:hypothetical protein